MNTRQIKFRGKRVDNGEWVYGSLITSVLSKDGTTINCYIKEQLLYYQSGWMYEVIPETVGQYTGLKDKSGKEIYEKDYDEDGNMIDYCEECCGYQFFQIDIPTKDVIWCHNCEGNFMLRDHLPDFKIAGNIRETPNLIKNQTA